MNVLLNIDTYLIQVINIKNIYLWYCNTLEEIWDHIIITSLSILFSYVPTNNEWSILL